MAAEKKADVDRLGQAATLKVPYTLVVVAEIERYEPA